MHRGHQALFENLGTKGAIVVIDNNLSSLTPANTRQKHTHYPILYLPLKDIKHLEADEFINLLRGYFPKLEKIVVGYDFCFGKDRKYCAAYLKEHCKSEVVVVDEVKFDGYSVHSRVIRKLIQQGNIQQANRLLGYNYTIEGRKITGQGLGQSKLFATINLEVQDFTLPKEGVYATLTRVDGSEHLYASVSFLGHRATTDGSFAIETHILEQRLTCTQGAFISFLELIRENKKFTSLAELKEAIAQDIAKAKQIHKSLIL